MEWFEFLPKKNQKKIEPKCVSEWLDTTSIKFDPIKHLTRYMIKCQKLHYAVQNYNDISAVIKYIDETNVLKVYNMNGAIPIS